MSRFTVADLTGPLRPGGPGPSVEWSQRCAALLRMDGVAVALRGNASELIWYSDERSARLDDLQFTLGEGPGVECARDGSLCLVGDLAQAPGPRWPAFVPGALAQGIRAVFAFPLRLGAIRIGVLTVHRRTATSLRDEAIDDALTISDALTLFLLGQGAEPASGHGGTSPPPPAFEDLRRAEVHQATGMVSTQLGLPLHTALDRLRAHAFAHDLPITEVARAIVTRRLNLRE
ncbi:hypothetical protein GCM10010252_30910 [Streptomyces aureoverticillatus]|nr:hypothetical protein GCM10010252_30910 [Streptomyces aureoverticillatus]